MSYKTVAICLLFVAWSALCYRQGGARQRLEVAQSTLKRESGQIATLQSDQKTVTQEAETYANATTAAIPDAAAPVVSVCYYRTAPAALPSAHPAGPLSHEAAPVPAARGGDPAVPVATVRRWDTKPVVQIGRDANAQVAGLQDYIAKVCQARAP